jgi:CheY-like chemotaxis protein
METHPSPLVLVVEDESLIRELAVSAIADAGFEVVEACTAAEALEVLRARPDVAIVFTDVNMPGELDGLALAEMVHRHWPAIQLVVTSGRPLAGPIPDEGKFVQKPYSLENMTEAVTTAAQRLDIV